MDQVSKRAPATETGLDQILNVKVFSEDLLLSNCLNICKNTSDLHEK